MKERLSNVLAWFAFLHASLLVSLFLLFVFTELLFGYEVPNNEPLASVINFYWDIVSLGGVFEMGVLLWPPLIWIALYVMNGKPRFLPWAK